MFVFVEWRERGEVLRARGLPDLLGVLGVARARKLYRNPFMFDRVFQAVILTKSRLSRPSGVSGFWLAGRPVTLSRSGWFTNHSKSFIHFSYIICAFTYHIVELVFVLLYIRSRVCGSIEYSGTRCGGYYLILWRLTTLIRRKILDSAVDVVSEALSMHVAPSVVRTVVVPTRMTVMLGLRNPPRSWTSTVGPFLPDSTIASCVDSLLCYRSIRWPKSTVQHSPKI
jgi:hypothetical protein